MSNDNWTHNDEHEFKRLEERLERDKELAFWRRAYCA